MRVWFNHWFSTVYHLIDMIKKAEPGKYTVIGTNEKGEAVYRCACDEWYTEPVGLSDEEYVRYCLDFCREHRVADSRGHCVYGVRHHCKLYATEL